MAYFEFKNNKIIISHLNANQARLLSLLNQTVFPSNPKTLKSATFILDDGSYSVEFYCLNGAKFTNQDVTYVKQHVDEFKEISRKVDDFSSRFAAIKKIIDG